ncbi:DNA-3-methyladenine glycosylase family protein [Sphingomonas astaxanthinifaciens]|uniref:DNA-3-methyladenine glycosylase II n=1 Tax=Sphingomonas astaxanthinifaciens DSM 22298 TaxID=1123267 RepID=A0ABQ5Z818_9SPHN|nr:DNA-3-methyladenine glycosylase [Sphingomonas astaxanthinifaciens]GLR48141.1 DNA-3-methyladenine glycosidase [Sphingomonas astaxanthinifaciens DSM 22298]
MVHSPESIDRALDHLTGAEPAFEAVIERHGVPEPRISERGTAALLRTIVGQQVSVAAARSMWNKLTEAYGDPPDLERLQAASDEELRALGQSRQKAGYLRSLAGLVLSGELDLASLPADNEEAIALLTRVKGIGRWSAEIYLLFAEGREDVFPAGDLAVQIELGRMFGLAERPSEKWLRERAEGWSPYRGAAALLAWHSYNTKVI